MESYLISSELFPLLSELLSDEQDGVRVTAIESTPAVGKLCPHKSLEAHLLPGIARCARDKKSWRVRFAVAENTRNILPFLESGAISEVVLEYMMALLEDKEPEVRSQAIIQVHALCHYASTQSVILKIIPIFEKSLEKDSSEHVRAALAEKICDIGGMLGKETVMAHILPIVMNLLKDEISEVRLSLLKNLDAIIKVYIYIYILYIDTGGGRHRDIHCPCTTRSSGGQAMENQTSSAGIHPRYHRLHRPSYIHQAHTPYIYEFLAGQGI